MTPDSVAALFAALAAASRGAFRAEDAEALALTESRRRALIAELAGIAPGPQRDALRPVVAEAAAELARDQAQADDLRNGLLRQRRSGGRARRAYLGADAATRGPQVAP
ncbi:hypothetical protein ACFQXB_05260 [Plastorhodobacter daqingensis]|uniref:Uncharacterized protein n=1 Tax=Plastorhodobacter daqingensis TaxID=1387281 RepID=A0ABW2UJ38_9RHOB